MVKVIGIIKEDQFTGVTYGLQEVNESVTEIQHASAAYKAKTAKIKKHKQRIRQKVK